MIELKLYTQGDALGVFPHEYYPNGSREGIDLLAKDPSSLFLTFWKQGRPIGVSGIMHQNERCAEVVMLVSSELQHYPKFLHKAIKTELLKNINGMKLRRVQATVRSDFSVGKKWLARLGFEQEGILRRFGPNDQDYAIWSLLP